LLNLGGGMKPVIRQVRQAPVLEAKNSMNSDHCFDYNELVWGYHSREAVLPGPFWLGYGSTGATT